MSKPTTAGECFEIRQPRPGKPGPHKISGRSSERAKNASRTFVGIAEAMAEQWGGLEC